MNQAVGKFSLGLQCYDYLTELRANSLNKRTIERIITKEFCVRIVTIFVSCILNAELVYRALAASFLTIQRVFSKGNEEALQYHTQTLKPLFTKCVNSYIAFYFPSYLPLPERQPPQEAAPAFLQGSREVPSVGSLSEYSDLQGAAAPHSAGGWEVESEKASLVEHPAEQVEVLNTPPRSPSLVSVNEHKSPIPALRNPRLEEPRSPSVQSLEEYKSPGVPSPIKEPSSPGLHGFELLQPDSLKEPGTSPKSPGNSSSSSFAFVDGRDAEKAASPLLHQAEEEPGVVRVTTFREPLLTTDENTVAASLARTFAEANGQLNVGDQKLPLLQGPPENFYDPKWKLCTGDLGTHSVGICHFAQNPDSPKTEDLSKMLRLTIDGKEVDVPLFGLFDPQVGTRAAQFLVHNLPDMIQQNLNFFGKDGLNQTKIWSALTQSFQNLQPFFRSVTQNSPDTTSATVSLILNDQIWVAHIGDSRAALNNAGQPIQLTSNRTEVVQGKPTTRTFGCAGNAKPVITRYNLENVLPHSQLILGSSGVFATTSTKQIANWLVQPTKAARDLAHDVIYSIAKNSKSPSLSALVVGLNVRADNFC